MIGVIGGNGVAATNKLCELIEEKLIQRGAFRDAHHPEMLIWQATQVPSRSMFYEGRGESFIPGYIEIGRKMKICGVTKVAICCNTAHMAIDEISEVVGLSFINLLKEVGKEVKNIESHRIGIMCSDSLSKSHFYNQFIMSEGSNIDILYPDPDYQKMVTQGISNAKNSKRYLPKNNVESPSYLFSEVIKHLKEKDVDCIVAGCTDIRNVFYPEDDLLGQTKYIDCLEVLADKIIEESNLNI